MPMLRFALAVLLSVASVSPAFAQGSPSGLPAATVPLDGADEMWIDQGAGCATNIAPCTSKKATSLRVGNPIQTNCTAISSPYTYQHCIDTSLGTPIEKIFYNGTWFSFVTLSNSLGPLLSGSLPSPFTVGGVSVTTTGAQLNYLNAATGTTGTTSSNLVYSNTPTLTSPIITGGSITGAAITGGSVPWSIITGAPVSNPNILVNADMAIDQPYEGASQAYIANTGGHYLADQWFAAADAANPAYSTQALLTDAPPGYFYSVKLTTTTGKTVVAGSFMSIDQPIEFNNVVDMAFGTANAQNVCLSFWAKSSIGPYTFNVSLRNQSGGTNPYSASTRSFPMAFTITSASTWQQFSQCFAGDSAGTWANVLRAEQMTLGFNSVVGSTFQGVLNTWQNGDIRGTSAATNTAYSTNGATFQIAAPKLEVATVVSPFTHNNWAIDLLMCQRYYEKSYAIGTAPTTVTATGQQDNALWGVTNATYKWFVPYRVTKLAGAGSNPTFYAPSNGAAGFVDLNGVPTGGNVIDKGQNGFNISSTLTPTVGGNVSFQWTSDTRM